MRLFLLLLSCSLPTLFLTAQVSQPVPPITCWTDGSTAEGAERTPVKFRSESAEILTPFELTFGDDLPTAAEASIQFAANIWGRYLQSTVPVRVFVDWRDQGDEDLLASAGPTDAYFNFRGARARELLYPVALAEAIVGQDLNGSDESDINIIINSTANWNFDTVGTVPRNRIDLATVVLHELGHGLGFFSSIDSTSDTTVSIGFDNRFIIYDNFLETPAGESLIDATLFSSPSEELLAAVIDRLGFNGPNAVRENGGELVALFSPQTFDVGSSVSHLDEAIYRTGNPNALMTPSIATGEAIRDPGPVTLGILEDLGWPLRYDLTPVREVIAGQLGVYPNPASDAFTFPLTEIADPTVAILYAADGREARRLHLSGQDERAQFSVAGLSPGLYTLLIPDGGRAFSGRVVVR